MNPDFAVRFAIGIICLSIFIYWKKKDALIYFQAWALFAAFFHFLLAYHDLTNILSRIERLFVTTLLFANSFIVILRLYKITQKYIPKKPYEKLSYKDKIIMKIFALISGLMHGGNNVMETKRRLSSRMKKF